MEETVEDCDSYVLKDYNVCELKEPTCDVSDIKNQQLSNKETNGLALLPPDHPLLSKFQQVLKEYLLRTKEQLTHEIDEIKYNVKLKEQQRDELGGKLYDMQRELLHQSQQLDEYCEEIEKYRLQREVEECALTELRNEYKEKLCTQKNLKTHYNKRVTELEHVQVLDNNISKWAAEIEDEVKNAKRVVSKDAQLQQQLSEEKKKSDMLHYHLNMEVKKREKELEIVRDELYDEREAINMLNVCISNATTDLNVLQNEHKRLTTSWSQVIVAISHRDKIWFQIQEALEKEKEFIKLATVNIDGIKKQITRELTQNEKLEVFKNRLAADFMILERECQKESETLSALERKLEELPMWLESTEKDFHESKKEGNQLEIELRRIQWKIDKQYNKKFEIEESILKLAQDQLITDKASEYRLKLLRNAQEQRRGIELALAQVQNQLADALLELEKSRGMIFKLRENNDDLKSKLLCVEARSDLQTNEIKNLDYQIDVKLKRIDKLSRQIDELMKSTQGIVGSPAELKIKQIEKAIVTAEQQIRDHQQFWLMLQNHYVNLSQKRNNQLNEIQVTQKQLSIIKQKSLKIDLDLEKSEQQTRELDREIRLYTKKIDHLNEKMSKKRHQQETQESECEMEHSQLLQKLKDNEMSVLTLEGDITDLQTEIGQYKNIVLEKHREALSWETKYKLVEETLRWRKEESTLESEIGNMKTEIHRMQIRYSQLKRAQEKLIQDLEHCVMHREQIFVTACAKQIAESKPHKIKTTTKIKQSIRDLQNKIKQTQNQLNVIVKKKIVELQREYQRVTDEALLTQADIQKEAITDRHNREKIEDLILQKEANLENIIRKQNRAKAYGKINIPALQTARAESTLQAQLQVQRDFNYNLIDIVQSLIAECPERRTFFNKILQILSN